MGGANMSSVIVIIFSLINLTVILGFLGLIAYTLILIIKALKIYIKNNENRDV